MVPGWKDPGYLGGESYIEGQTRLKEIYAKIFNISAWQNAKECSQYICGRVDEPVDDPTANSNAGDSGGYWGGQECSPDAANSCNQHVTNDGLGNDVSCTLLDHVCINSLFNDSSGVFNKTCSVDSNCKIPIDPTTGALKGMTCALSAINPAIGNTCWYNNGVDPNQEALINGVPLGCSGPADCNSINADTNPIAALNSTASCSLGGHFCVGVPFTVSTSTPIFNQEVPCDRDPAAPDGKMTNHLGYVLNLDASICGTLDTDVANYNKTHGSCVRELDDNQQHPVKDLDGAAMCTPRDQGYQPMCDPQTQTCPPAKFDSLSQTWVGTPSVASLALPLDATIDEKPILSPYIIPVLCDSNGQSCGPVDKTTTPATPITVKDFTPPTMNGFSVNNLIGGSSDPAMRLDTTSFGGGTSARVIDGYQNYLASLKFYMAGDKNHLPIRYISLDWGDGMRQARVGFYQNYLPMCDPKSLGPDTSPNPPQTPLDYAGTAQACKTEYRNNLHIYAYSPTIGCGVCQNVTRVCGQDSDCADPTTAADTWRCDIKNNYEASCYRPRVMVQDNWGWCTNGFYGEEGQGCFDTNIGRKCSNSDKYCTVPADCQVPTLGTCLPAPAFAPRYSGSGYVEFPNLIMVHRDAK